VLLEQNNSTGMEAEIATDGGLDNQENVSRRIVKVKRRTANDGMQL